MKVDLLIEDYRPFQGGGFDVILTKCFWTRCFVS